tara:strand:+ start:533 stop:1126 length:594 start_codon:yes stop_codon:yes gene_type:complete
MRSVPHELTQDEIGKTLAAEAKRVVSLAHKRERWLRTDRGDPCPADQRFSMFVQGWQSRIHYTYSVDVRPYIVTPMVVRRHEPLPEQTEPDLFEIWRHLSIQLSVPDKVGRAEIATNEAMLLRLYEPQVQAFYPVAERVRIQWEPTDPIPVQRPDLNAQGLRKNAVTFRTVITGHFLIPWGSDRDDRCIKTAEELTA